MPPALPPNLVLIGRKARPARSPAQLGQATPLNPPRKRKPKPKHVPVIDAAAFKKRHWDVDKQVRGRFKRLTPEEATWKVDIEYDMAPENERYLYANNAGSRIRFGEMFAKALRREAHRNYKRTFFWVTLAWSKHEVPLHEARAFNIRSLKSATYEVLQKTSFVGMIEAGFNSVTQNVEWHAHALVWDVPPWTLKSRLEMARKRAGGGASGRLNVRSGPLSNEDVEGKARYMCKGQIKEYRTWVAKVVYPVADRETGEVFDLPAFEDRRRPRNIEPINAYRMFQIFRGRFIDEFAFAARGGQ